MRCRWLVLVLTPSWWAFVASCGSADTSATSARDAGAGVPDGCAGVDNAYQSGTCLSALRALCRAHTTEAQCLAQAPITTYGVVCTWAGVITISDPASCAFSPLEGRCEAGWTFPQDGPFCGVWYAFPQEGELVKVHTCGGPVGPWDEIGVVHNTAACLTNAPPPGICECVDKVASQ